MMVTKNILIVVLVAACTYNALLLSVALPILISAFAVWLLAIPALVVVARRSRIGGWLRGAVLGGLVVGIISGAVAIVTKPEYQLDSDWATVSSDFSASAPLLEKYMKSHTVCPRSSVELRGRPMFDPFSRGDYKYTQVGSECSIHSVGFDLVDDAMMKAANPRLRALRSDQFPLSRVIFGKNFSDDAAVDGDLWIRCSRETGCRSSF